MALYRPPIDSNAEKKKNAQRRRKRLGIGIAAALILAGAGFLAFLYLGDGRNVEPNDDDAPARTNRVQKAAPPISAPVKKPGQKEPAKPDPNARPTKVGEVVNGYVLLPSGRMHKRTGVITNTPAMRPKGKYAIFTRKTDNEIAAYLSMRLGDTLVGTPRYNGRFKKEFPDGDAPKIPGLSDSVCRYLVHVKNADAMMGMLAEGLSKAEKPGIMALYGDHLPNLPDLITGGETATPYIVWRTDGTPGISIKKDIRPEEIGGAIFAGGWK